MYVTMVITITIIKIYSIAIIKSDRLHVNGDHHLPGLYIKYLLHKY